MRRVATLVVTASLTGMACGGGISVQTDYNPGAVNALTEYVTYDWMPPPADRSQDTVLTEIDESRLETAIEGTLAEKGYRKKTSGQTDFKVGYHVTLQGKTDYRTINNSYGYGWGGWGYGGFGTTVSTTQQINWTVGTLIIDIVSGDSNELVWRGIAQGEVGQERTPEERQDLINEAVAKMFADFPPGS